MIAAVKCWVTPSLYVSSENGAFPKPGNFSRASEIYRVIESLLDWGSHNTTACLPFKRHAGGCGALDSRHETERD